MNTLWLVWCRRGVHHIFVSGCVSAKLSEDLSLRQNVAEEWYFTAWKTKKKIGQFGIITQTPVMFPFRYFYFVIVFWTFGVCLVPSLPAKCIFIRPFLASLHHRCKHWVILPIWLSHLPLSRSLCRYGAWEVADRDWLTRAHACCGSEG